ncbi:cellulose-binding protein, partial [Streptomyces sp. SID7909]|nr:cellulose-binding protein [Streptomyces sp. SID7909]
MDRFVAELAAERDGAVDRVARLTERAEELAAESARLDGAVARLAPPDYGPLGERALRILALAEEEAGALLGAAREE